MMAWVLLLQAGVGGDPGLEKAWKIHEQGDSAAALEQVRKLDPGGTSTNHSCFRAELAEIVNEHVEAWLSVRRCLAHLGWESEPTLYFDKLQERLSEHITAVRTANDVPAYYEGELVESWPLWVHRGDVVKLEFDTPEGRKTKGVEAWRSQVLVHPPREDDAGAQVVVNGDVDMSEHNAVTTNNFLGERPPGAFPLRKSTQVAGVVIGLAGAGLATYGLVGYVNAESAANRSAEYTNANGGCPAAGSRCEEYEKRVNERNDSRGTVVLGGAVAAGGIAAVVLGTFLPKWIGGAASTDGARLELRGSF